MGLQQQEMARYSDELISESKSSRDEFISVSRHFPVAVYMVWSRDEFIIRVDVIASLGTGIKNCHP